MAGEHLMPLHQTLTNSQGFSHLHVRHAVEEPHDNEGKNLAFTRRYQGAVAQRAVPPNGDFHGTYKNDPTL